MEEQEAQLLADPRLAEAVALFNDGAWYEAHDGFEALWHETNGPMRVVLQAILQISVAQLHLERGNRHGATVLMGEGLGRLRQSEESVLGLNLAALRARVQPRLEALQRGEDPGTLPEPLLDAL